MRRLTGLSLLAALVLALLLPLLFGQIMIGGLGKLHLSPGRALLLMFAIMLGGLINIPVFRIRREEEVPAHPLALFGMAGTWPRLNRGRRETVIAVNVGGCLIPTGLAIYELLYLAEGGLSGLGPVLVACAATIGVCYVVARPVAGVGIVMPGLVSPLVAATLALLLAPDQAGPVAFIAGVAGPLIGADLLHLREIWTSAVGIASIGGAGTFDGIVLSGVLAAYLT